MHVPSSEGLKCSAPEICIEILDNRFNLSIIGIIYSYSITRLQGHAMITKLKLKPGQRGTKKLAAEYGDALVCVRYRYDNAKKVRHKTIELIVESKPWTAPAPTFADTDLVPVYIGFSDIASREIAREAKGRWDPEQKLWLISYGRIKGTELEKHIILDAFPQSSKRKSI